MSATALVPGVCLAAGNDLGASRFTYVALGRTPTHMNHIRVEHDILIYPGVEARCRLKAPKDHSGLSAYSTSRVGTVVAVDTAPGVVRRMRPSGASPVSPRSRVTSMSSSRPDVQSGATTRAKPTNDRRDDWGGAACKREADPVASHCTAMSYGDAVPPTAPSWRWS